MKGYCFSNNVSNVNYNKVYYVTTLNDNILCLYCITLIKSDKQLYLYLFDFFNDESHMIHVFSPNEKYNIIEPYIQISPDMKIISIPDDDYLYFYNVEDIIKDGLLRPTSHNTKIHLQKLTIESLSEHTPCNKKQIVPYKCILYDTKYVMLFEENIYIYCLESKETTILNIEYKKTYFTLSKSCKYIGYWASTNVIIQDLKSKQEIRIPAKIAHNIVISDDAKYVLICQDKYVLTYKLIGNEYNLISEECYLTDENYVIWNTNDINQINQLNNQCDITHLISKWHKKNHTLEYILVSDRKVYNPQTIELHIDDNIKYIYVNGLQFVCVYDAYLVLYDIRKILPLFIINATLDDLTKILTIRNPKEQTNLITVVNAKTDAKIKQEYLIQKWLSDLFTYDYDSVLVINTLSMDITPIVECKTLLIEMIIMILHDHTKIEGFTMLLGKEILSRQNIEQIVNVWIKVVKKIVTTETDYKNFYAEYCLIKFVLLYMISYSTNKTNIVVHNKKTMTKTKTNVATKTFDISLLVQIFKNLSFTRKYFMNAVSIMFNMNFIDYVASKS